MASESLKELKIVVRSVIVACKNQLTVNELWKRTIYEFGRPQLQVQLKLFGYDTPLDFLKSIPDVVQLEDPEDTNSIVYLVSSKLSRHMELLVSKNIIRPPKSKFSHNNLSVPYRIQCAFIRIFYELYREGLSISTFKSDVLCIPIFQSYINCVDLLLSSLDHVFIRRGMKIISLHPRLVNGLKEIIETGDKYTAMDIFNIDEYSLENRYDDQRIYNGLEYPLFYILEETIKTNIEQLLNEIPGWISDIQIYSLYNDKFGSEFNHYRRWGFSRISQMLCKLPELGCVHFSINDIYVISSLKHTCHDYKNTNYVSEEVNESSHFSINAKEKYDNGPNENDGVIQEIQHSELKINNSLNVNVCGVYTNIVPTIICQSVEQYHVLQKLINDMTNFYFVYDTNLLFDPTIAMVKQTFAYCFDDCWFRGIVIDINLSVIKIMNIDNGLMHTISFEDIRLLHKRFSKLPPQSLTCYLHGIDSIDEDELLKIIDKKCTIYVVSTDQQNKSATVKIKFMDSVSDKYLNEEWIESGVAKPDSDEE
ncbi:uncharacterized protein LOC132934018 [Metopolophium dirhodum]|uniref:uncharacterized protein LOC132934018 n=1 Tax=Metopolophium dirhodum TaxID=44670 RepID=UPI002990241C|nr:uncharacterized protein LOC132934018 [Metopolophium dirhodum]